jgi:hypothetical protein
MRKLAFRLLTLAMFSMSLLAAPTFVSICAAGGDPTPSNDSKPVPQSKKKTSEISPGSEDAAFTKGYRTAYATIYDRNEITCQAEQQARRRTQTNTQEMTPCPKTTNP